MGIDTNRGLRLESIFSSRARTYRNNGQEEQNKIEAFLTPVACQKGALIMNPQVIEKIH